MYSRNLSLVLLAVAAAAVGMLVLLVALNGTAAVANADSSRQPRYDATPIHYVATTGVDSGDCSTPGGACQTVQYAVSQAGIGDEIRVAAGLYTGVQYVGGHTQTVNIDKTVVLRGGFATGNWTTPNPEANRTILDAEGQGRVMYISNNVSPIIDGFILTGGWSDVTSGFGGGIFVKSGTPLFVRSVITDNLTTFSYGGGFYVDYGARVVISASRIVSNSADIAGGGFSFSGGAAGVLQGNYIASNRSDYGDAINMSDAVVTATKNVILDNGEGSAIVCSGDLSRLVVVNNVIARSGRAGIYAVSECRVTALHNSIVSNTRFGLETGYDAVITLTNNIIADHQDYESISVHPTYPATITASHNLFWNNGSDSVTGAAPVFGDPDFVDPANGDYHIGPDSAAISQALPLPGVAQDIDGETRPIGVGADIGADERAYFVYLPLVLRDY